MFTPNLKVTSIVSVTLLLIVGGIWLSVGDHSPVQAADTKDSKVKALLKEKLSLLKEVSTQMTARYQQGQISMGDVFEATQAVRKAELDLCADDKERVVVLEKMLTEAKEYEKVIDQQVKAARLPATDRLKANVRRLDVEIELERVKAH